MQLDKTIHPWTRATLGLLLLVPVASAQVGVRPTDVISQAHGVERKPAGGVGMGRDYRADFDAGTFTYTPALGRAARRTMPLSFTLEDIRRGEEPFVTADLGRAPQIDGDLVTYRRTSGVEERYEVRAEGVYQSFVFPERPAGSGDLVVRGRIATELTPVATAGSGDGLVFELADVGGVRWGAVTGIDAGGETVAGTVRLIGDVLELSLPESFVDTARFPLVLDPLIGTDFSVTSAFDNDDPDVAFIEPSGHYLVVWTRVFSIFDAQIRGQLVTNIGSLTGTLLALSNSAELSQSPAVTSVQDSGRFLVAWRSIDLGDPTSTDQIQVRAVDASTGVSSGILALSPSANSQTNPSIGGPRSLGETGAIVVWDELGVGIRGRRVIVLPGGNPIPFGPALSIAADGPFSQQSAPEISRTHGNAGNFVVAWQRDHVIFGCDVFAQVVDVGFNLIGGPLRVSTGTTSGVATNPSVDGNGVISVVAFEVHDVGMVGNTDVSVVALHSRGTLTVEAGPLELAAHPADIERGPAVAWVGDQALVAYLEDSSGFQQVRARSIDPFSCLPCESSFDVGTPIIMEGDVVIGSEFAGGGGNGALIAWESRTPFSPDSDIRAALYSAGTAEVNLGGLCGSGGIPYTPCAYAGNLQFRAHLEGAPASAPTFLLLSAGTAPFACGPCTLVPSLTGSLMPATTNVNGIASIALPIPPGAAGAVSFGQWITLLPGGPCALFPNFRLSDALQTTVD